MDERFGEILRATVRKKYSVRAFASAAGVSAGYISRVIAGERWPLPSRLRQWADLLDLPASERMTFILSAELEAAPTELRDHVLELRRNVARGKTRK